jgi:hypothetical protein
MTFKYWFPPVAWVIIWAVISIVVLCIPVDAAEYLGRDYPYFIYNDDGAIRYCMVPELEDTHMDCWANGIKQSCKITNADTGYIDCGH